VARPDLRIDSYVRSRTSKVVLIDGGMKSADERKEKSAAFRVTVDDLRLEALASTITVFKHLIEFLQSTPARTFRQGKIREM